MFSLPMLTAMVGSYGVGNAVQIGYDGDYPKRIMRKAEPLLAERLSERREADPKIDGSRLESCAKGKKECREDSEKAKKIIAGALSLLGSVECSIPRVHDWGQIVRKSTRTIYPRDDKEFCDVFNGGTDTSVAVLSSEATSTNICIIPEDEWKIATTILHEGFHNIPLRRIEEVLAGNETIYMEVFELPTREQAYEAFAFSAVIGMIDDYDEKKATSPWYGMIFAKDLRGIKARSYGMLEDVKQGTYGHGK